jgi:hypothetical protein
MIIFMIVKQKKNASERRLYHRLLLAIAGMDVITSSIYMLGPLPVRDDVGAYMAKGNVTTCTAYGFLLHLVFAGAIYNMGLMWTFLCQVRYEVREDVIAQHYERKIHVMAIGFPLLTGIVGLIFQVFNPVNSLGLLKCYIAAYPPDCDLVDSDMQECTRGSMARPFLVVGAMIPFFIVLGFLFSATFLVWWTVRQHAIQTRGTSQFNVQSNISREVAIQSIIYGIFFFNTYVWVLIDPLVDVVIGGGSSKMRIVVRVVSEIFYPSQGLWTWLIFIRPRYLRIRTNCREQSLMWVLHETVWGETLDHAKYMNTSRSACMRARLSQQQSQQQQHHQQQQQSKAGSGSFSFFQQASVGSGNADCSGSGGDGPVSTTLQDSGNGNPNTASSSSSSTSIHRNTTTGSESLVQLEKTTTTSSSIAVRWDPSLLLTTKDDGQVELAQEPEQPPQPQEDQTNDISTVPPPPVSMSLKMTGAVLQSSNGAILVEEVKQRQQQGEEGAPLSTMVLSYS